MTPRRRKHNRRIADKPYKAAERTMKQSEESTFRFNGSCFRLLAFQPLSLVLEDSRPFELSIQNITCRISLRTMHGDGASQRTNGGTFIVIDFSLADNTDLLLATKKGLDLVGDFFSAVALIEGATFRDIEPIQILCTDQTTPQNYTFIYFLTLSMHHWDTPVSNDTIDAVRGLLAHWDGLDSGKRLRRAARNFSKAIETNDDLAAFQYAYMGLEALEPPLAKVMEIPPGVEIISGKCEKCGAEYTQRKTVLAAVRAYVCGALHPQTAIPERKQEWKNINDLRQKLFHSLGDNNELEQKAHGILPAAMHHLHDAVCCLSHAHNFETPTYKLARGMHNLVLVGQFCAGELGPLEEWRPLFNAENGHWVEHPQHGFVPRFKICKAEFKDIQGGFYWMNAPLGRASKENLVPANWEDSQSRAGF